MGEKLRFAKLWINKFAHISTIIVTTDPLQLTRDQTELMQLNIGTPCREPSATIACSRQPIHWKAE
jgi:hypothetical protein